MPNTTYLTLPYPALSNAPNVPQDMQNLASGLDGKLAGVIICTSTTRPTARDGAVIYETNTKRYMTYSSTLSAWIQHTATRVATAPVTVSATTWTTTETGALITASPTLVSGATYKITLSTKVSATVASDVSFMRIREDNSLGTQIDGACVFIGSPTSNGYPLTMYVEYTAVASAAKSFVVTGQRIGGTGTHQISCSVNRPTYLTVDLVVS